MRTLTPPNPHLRDAVAARQEIDLRIGAAFTRWQTDRLRRKFGGGNEELKNVISYGPCQVSQFDAVSWSSATFDHCSHVVPVTVGVLLVPNAGFRV